MSTLAIRIVAAGFHASIVLLGLIVFSMADSAGWSFSWRLTSGHRLLLYALLCVSVGCGALALLWPRFGAHKSSDPAVPSPIGDPIPLLYNFSQMTRAIQIATIIRMALAEAIAQYGLILALIVHSAAWILPFGIVGLLLQILVGPFWPVRRSE